jgi:hypothetical protein
MMLKCLSQWPSRLQGVVAAVAVATVGAVALPAPAARAATANFPLFESMNGQFTHPWTTAGSTAFNSGWLRLTSEQDNMAGTAVMDDAFPSSRGITVEFDYAAYGGFTYNGSRGDGMTLFLLDGTAPSSTVGAPGAGLGYACTSSPVPGPCQRDGVTGGYLGVGFDEFGNFSSLAGNNTGPGSQPGEIVVRGSGSGTTGFRYLTGAPGPGGTVETGSRAGFRKVRLALSRLNNTLVLNVWSSGDGGQGWFHAITDFDVEHAAGQAALPPTLKLGFSASTGLATNIHELRDVQVDVPSHQTCDLDRFVA